MDNPEKYVGSSQLQYRDASEVISEFCEELKKMEGRIIDIGCGPGIVTKKLILPNVGENAVIVGADISAAMIEYAKKRYENEEKLSFIQLDLETSDLPKNLIGHFDHAVSFFCLNWCRNTELAIENIYNLLRLGGKAVVLLTTFNSVFDFYLEQQNDLRFSSYMQDALKYIPPYHGQPNSEKMLRATLAEVGFKVLHCTNRQKIYSYETMELQLDMLMAVNPFLSRMPEDIRKQYREDIEMRIRKKLLRMNKSDDSENCTVDDHYEVLVALFEKPLN